MELPEDIVNVILSFVDSAEDLVHCGRVCKLWATLHRHDRFWKPLYKNFWDVWNRFDVNNGHWRTFWEAQMKLIHLKSQSCVPRIVWKQTFNGNILSLFVCSDSIVVSESKDSKVNIWWRSLETGDIKANAVVPTPTPDCILSHDRRRLLFHHGFTLFLVDCLKATVSRYDMPPGRSKNSQLAPLWVTASGFIVFLDLCLSSECHISRLLCFKFIPSPQLQWEIELGGLTLVDIANSGILGDFFILRSQIGCRLINLHSQQKYLVKTVEQSQYWPKLPSAAHPGSFPRICMQALTPTTMIEISGYIFDAPNTSISRSIDMTTGQVLHEAFGSAAPFQFAHGFGNVFFNCAYSDSLSRQIIRVSTWVEASASCDLDLSQLLDEESDPMQTTTIIGVDYNFDLYMFRGSSFYKVHLADLCVLLPFLPSSN